MTEPTDDPPFPPASAVFPDDMDARRMAAIMSVRRRRRAKAGIVGVACVGIVAGSAVVINVSLNHTRAAKPSDTVVVSDPSPSNDALPTPTPTPGPSFPAVVASAAPTPTPTPPMRHGTVHDSAGRPIAGVWVTPLSDLSAAHVTNSAGEYTLPCTTSPLVATDWRIPGSSAAPGEAFSQLPGLGHAYAWTGGGATMQEAAPLPDSCGAAVNIVMAPGAAIDVRLQHADGSAYSPVVPDDLFQIDLAGFGTVLQSTDAARWDATGYFHLSGLRTEQDYLDPVFNNWKCSGLSGPVKNGAYLPVMPTSGSTTTVICTRQGAASPRPASATPSPSPH